MRYGQKCPGGLFFADDDAGPRLVKQKGGGGINPTRINTPTTARKRLAVPYSPTTHQLQYHQRRKA